ncbi:MAG: hypothetical protein ABEJ70_03085 [Halobacteriaceae archaeon]
MVARAQRRVVRLTAAWSLAAVVVLGAAGELTGDRWFVASLVGFMLVVEATSPAHVMPPWRTRLRWVVVAGLLVFAALVAVRV